MVERLNTELVAILERIVRKHLFDINDVFSFNLIDEELFLLVSYAGIIPMARSFLRAHENILDLKNVIFIHL